MKICDLAGSDIRSALKSTGLQIQIGPFWFSIRSKLPDVHEHLTTLYRYANTDSQPRFIDFSIEVDRKKSSIRGWLKPVAEFTFNGNVPFTPLPLDQSPALLEWGINWCVSAHAHQFLILHAAVVEKYGKALVMPALSGSGKSTLTAALVSKGWRLLSDELALLCVDSGQVFPFTKPISLKNASIDVIKDYWLDARFGKSCTDTVKGTVSHLCPPDASVVRTNDSATVAAFIFPKFRSGAAPSLSSRAKSSAYMTIVENAFNYYLLGERGFECVSYVLNHSEAFDLSFGDLDDAIELINQIWGGESL